MAGKLAVVFGGSGFLGRNVVRELAKRGWRVRIAVRRPHHAQFLRPMGAVGQVQLFQANVRYPASVAEALKGADAVINLVGLLTESGSQKFHRVQAAGAATIAELAREEGIDQFVQVSAIGADVTSSSAYARTKAQAEDAVREAIPTAVIIRPSIIFGPEDNFFNRFAAMALISPILPIIGDGKTQFQPVYVDNVADVICGALDQPSTSGRTFELGGPKVYSFKELLELMLSEIGRKRILVPLPFVLAPMAGLAGEFAGFLPFMDAPITRDQVKLLRSDNIVGLSGEDDIGDISTFDITPTSLEAILPSYMVQYRKYGQFTEEVSPS